MVEDPNRQRYPGEIPTARIRQRDEFSGQHARLLFDYSNCFGDGNHWIVVSGLSVSLAGLGYTS